MLERISTTGELRNFLATVEPDLPIVFVGEYHCSQIVAGVSIGRRIPMNL